MHASQSFKLLLQRSCTSVLCKNCSRTCSPWEGMALGRLVTVLHACLDMKSTILGKYHYILYIIVLAMQVPGGGGYHNAFNGG